MKNVMKIFKDFFYSVNNISFMLRWLLSCFCSILVSNNIRFLQKLKFFFLPRLRYFTVPTQKFLTMQNAILFRYFYKISFFYSNYVIIYQIEILLHGFRKKKLRYLLNTLTVSKVDPCMSGLQIFNPGKKIRVQSRYFRGYPDRN